MNLISFGVDKTDASYVPTDAVIFVTGSDSTYRCLRVKVD